MLKHKDRRMLSLPKDWWALVDEIARLEERENPLEIIRQFVRRGLLDRAHQHKLKVPADLAVGRETTVGSWGKPTEKSR